MLVAVVVSKSVTPDVTSADGLDSEGFVCNVVVWDVVVWDVVVWDAVVWDVVVLSNMDVTVLVVADSINSCDVVVVSIACFNE